MSRWREAGLAVVLVLGVGACAAVPSDRALPSAAPARSSPPATTAPGTTAPGTTALADATTSTTSAAGTATATAGERASGRWSPAPGATWQYQLSGDLDTTVDADVYDVDWQTTTSAQVRALHAAGRRVVCYVNAGAFESYRPDAGSYPREVLGAALDGWPGERWVDVRRTDVVLPLLAARMDVCRQKGFDAVEADNVDGFSNDSGFDLTAADQLNFNTAVAGLAHQRGLSVALKNDVEQIGALEPVFDFAVNEECLVYDECDAYRPFVRAGKAVLHVEYTAPDRGACARAAALGLSTIIKGVDLGAHLERC